MASIFDRAGKWLGNNVGKVAAGVAVLGSAIVTGGAALPALSSLASGVMSAGSFVASNPMLASAAVAAGSGFLADKIGRNVPSPQTTPDQPIAEKFAPLNFASIFDELTKDQLDIVRNNDGQMQLRFGNNNNRVDLETPVSSGNVNTRLPALRNIDSRAVEVVALSQAMTNLGNTIEEMERTSPYLIQQNQALINSFRESSNRAIERGFDFRQNSIDQRLKKAGLDNSSTAFGVQVALAREKANAYVERELNEANLAQGLKQQTIANLHQRSEQIGQNAQLEQNRFNSERAIEAQNEQMRQDQAGRQAALDLQANQQRIDTDFANKAMIDGRRQRMAELGANLFNQGNQQSIGAQEVDNKAVGYQNQAQYHRYGMTANPFRNALNSVSGRATEAFTDNLLQGANPGFRGNVWN